MKAIEKIRISICSSPRCHIEGARLFKQLDTTMSAILKEKTTRTGSGCHGYCKTCGEHAPCAMVNNHPIFRATPEKIIKAITATAEYTGERNHPLSID